METKAIRVLIADDEPLARRQLAALIEPLEHWHLVGEAGSGGAVHELIPTTSPDVVFLDIRMPGQSGLEVARLLSEISPRPLVVFATAFDEHALEAFEVEAADYLLKPFERKRFSAAIGRLERRLLGPQGTSMRESSTNLPQEGSESSHVSRVKTLAVKSVGRVRLIDVREIHWIAAAGNYVRLYLADSCFLHRATLASLENELDRGAFLRIHRSTLIQRRQVAEIRSSAAGRSQVVLKDGTELEISQRFRQQVIASLVPSR